MSFVKSYVLQARTDAVGELKEALSALRTAVESLPGSLGAELLQDLDRPGSFHFVERWGSQAEQRSAGKALAPALMEAIQAALSEPPSAFSLGPI